jgi:hypothetical protein
MRVYRNQYLAAPFPANATLLNGWVFVTATMLKLSESNKK